MADWPEPPDPEPFDVWEENHTAVMLFSACATQWRAGPAGLIGLDYGVVLAVMELYSVEDRAEALEDVQIMEAAALAILNKEAGK